MRAIAWLVCLAGCHVVWRLDDVHNDSDPDAMPSPDAAVCFDTPVTLLAGPGNHDPTLREDGLELFFVAGFPGNYELYTSKRDSLVEPFVNVGLVGVGSTMDDADPALTTNGLTLVFKSHRSGAWRGYQVTRLRSDVPFAGPAALIQGMESIDVLGIDLSGDGLTIYFDDGSTLNSATRSTIMSPVAIVKTLSPERLQFPTVAASGLEVYYNGDGIVRRTRPSESAVFDAAGIPVLQAPAADPDLSYNDRRMVLEQAGDIRLSERCP